MWEQSEHRMQTSRRVPKERRVRRARRKLTPQAWQDRRAPQGPRRTGWDHRCGPAREPTGRAGPRGHRRSPHTTVRMAERAQKEPRARAQKEPRARAQKEPRARKEQRTRARQEQQRTRDRRGRSRGSRARSGRERWRGRARAGRSAPPSPAIRGSCGRHRSRWAFALAASTRPHPAPRHRVRPQAPRACAGRRGGCRSGPSARCARR